jgi:hypothetical protein
MIDYREVTFPPSPVDVHAPPSCICGYGDCCVCPTTEKALRAILHADLKMTEEQREWCKREIDKVEGHGRNDYIDADDSTIAGGVLNAWVDYARDKGLL